jgi:hypothetical protein
MEAGRFNFWRRFGSVTGFFQTCSFAKASPEVKNPGSERLHYFLKSSSFASYVFCSFSEGDSGGADLFLLVPLTVGGIIPVVIRFLLRPKPKQSVKN